MERYSKAIGATIGAGLAWLLVFGVESAAEVDVGAVTEALMMLGALFGAERAPKNAN